MLETDVILTYIYTNIVELQLFQTDSLYNIFHNFLHNL